LANGISGGNIPVVYARGNHETKSKQAESLYKYVGASDTNYYYTFRLGSVWGVVLDMGENHVDDWKEFFGTANFQPYRDEQLDMLDEIIANKETTYQAEGITHKIAISHINTSYVSTSNNFMYDFFIELNQRLNEIDVDVMLSGHLHQVLVAPKGMITGSELRLVTSYTGEEKESEKAQYIATGAMYDTIICARRSNTQVLSKKEKVLGRTYTGTALHHKIDSAGDKILEVKFTTNRKKILNTINPFTGENLGNTIYLY
jgi:DNA repair exonuclease SbcCD nuclease subunit